MAVAPELKDQLLAHQRNEITEYHIYRQLARTIHSAENRRALKRIAEDEPFRQRFFEMAGLSLGVAALSFVVGLLIREFLGVEI